ncbi:MAG TPA: hypothetical protein VG268_10170 [Streptosporangiaceae bacterium]|nr:hypothetical protein [Streptosporangiaceae bacterium]
MVGLDREDARGRPQVGLVAACAAAVKLLCRLISGWATAELPSAERRNATWSCSSLAISVANWRIELVSLPSAGHIRGTL